MPATKEHQTLPKTALEAVKGYDLSGKVFLITGAYSGLGAASTRALLSAGATVIAAGRNAKSQADFAAGFSSGPGTIDAEMTLDLGNLASVRDFAHHIQAKYATIDCLMNNAGVMNTPPGKTSDGFEVQMGTNVIGHFLLAKLLAPQTKRQIWLSSTAHLLIGDPPGDVHDHAKAPRINLDIIDKVDDQAYDSWHRYQQSKLGNILLAKRFPIEFGHIESCAVHPGVVRTNLSRHMSIVSILKYVWAAITGKGSKILTPEQGARTQTLCAIMHPEDLVPGGYYADCILAREGDSAQHMDDAKRLYDYCDNATRHFQE
ncbi:MAG: SDR family NAD(P)-dependent oxidoreductase [Rhodothermales bacterium]|nr:SDR family NAD(P)-dependent oxidoreductase [Rhodothermales bacterium]